MKYRESLDPDLKTELLVKLINIHVTGFLHKNKNRGVEGHKVSNYNIWYGKTMELVTTSWLIDICYG